MVTIKERLVELYQEQGIDFVSACQFATEWLADLKRQPPGTQWTLGTPGGRCITVQKNEVSR